MHDAKNECHRFKVIQQCLKNKPTNNNHNYIILYQEFTHK